MAGTAIITATATGLAAGNTSELSLRTESRFIASQEQEIPTLSEGMLTAFVLALALSSLGVLRRRLYGI